MKNLHKSPDTGVPAALSTGHRHYLRHYHFHRLLVIFFRIFLLTGFLFLWEFCASHQIIDSFIFSSPSKIMNALLLMISDHSIFLHLGVTLYETFVSFFLVIFVSILFAILLWYSNNLSEILEPYLVVLNSLPKSALAPLLIVWLGATKTTIIVTGMSVAIFGSILNLYTSFRSTDPGKIKLIYTLRGNHLHVLTKVILPYSIPAIISNMKVNIGLCLVGVIIGEFLAAKEGLGYLIIYSSQVFKMDWLLMSICILCVFAIFLYALIDFGEKLYFKHF
jgi:NitT/TauT family transport system permease protein